jgi:hypothetical protein
MCHAAENKIDPTLHVVTRLIVATVISVIRTAAVEVLTRHPTTLEAVHEEQTKTSRETGKIEEVIPIVGAAVKVDTKIETEKAIEEVVSHHFEHNGSGKSQIRKKIVGLQ